LIIDKSKFNSKYNKIASEYLNSQWKKYSNDLTIRDYKSFLETEDAITSKKHRCGQ